MMELLLVLALFVAVAASALPAFQGSLENYRLRKAADLVRARWAKARSEAMRSGRTMMFRFQPGQTQYQLAPWYDNQDYLESSNLMTASLTAGTVPAANAMNTVGPSAAAKPPESLPEGTHFVGAAAVTSTRDARIQQSLLDQTAASQAEWSPPLLFYPDGTSSTTRIILANQRAQYIVLSLRGLSGVTEVSDLMTAAELPQ